jgi:hypothetical protein
MFLSGLCISLVGGVKILAEFKLSFLTYANSLRNPDASSLWERMTSIKHSILSMWDTAPAPVKVCCIKFAQKVVHVQTPGPIADPRVSNAVNLLFILLSLPPHI